MLIFKKTPFHRDFYGNRKIDSIFFLSYLQVCSYMDIFKSGYSLSPDLANAATVSVSLIEGNMEERPSNLGGNGLEAARFRNIMFAFFFVFHAPNHRILGPFVGFNYGSMIVSMKCIQKFLKYYIQMVVHILAINPNANEYL